MFEGRYGTTIEDARQIAEAQYAIACDLSPMSAAVPKERWCKNRTREIMANGATEAEMKLIGRK